MLREKLLFSGITAD